MKLLLRLAIFFTLGITPILSQAQAVNGDYRTQQDGNWNVAATWQIRSSGSWITATNPPSAATTNLVTIRNNHTVTVTGTQACGGALDIIEELVFNNTSASSLTVGGDLSGSGEIDMSGGSLLHTLNLGGTNNAITTFTTAAVASTVHYNYAGNQQIFGSNNYRNLTVSGSGTKTLQATSKVNENLSVSGTATLAFDNKQLTGTAGGLLNLGAGTTLSLGRTGDASPVLFPANFTTSNITLDPTSTVIYQNGASQTVSAAPVYSNLTIAGGGTKNLVANTTVNGTLTLNNGLLSPGAFDLTLGATATTAGSFSATSMILSGGGNVIKKYDAVGAAPITLPFGTTGIYTPAIFKLTGANFGGAVGTRSVIIKPVVGAPGAQLDATYSLNKHWTVSTPNLTNLIADLSFTYDTGEANATAEPGYVSAYSLVSPATLTPMTWVTNTGTVNTGTNTISYTNFTNAGSLSNSIWTTAPSTAFAPGTFYSLASGNYEANTTWSTVGYGGAVSPTPPTVGSSVYVGNNRTVTMTANGKTINVLQIDATGTLDLSTFTGINIVTFNTATTAGTAGKLRLSAASGTATLPTVSGTNNFLNTAGSTVEYSGAGSYSLPALPTAYQNLTISGSNTKTLQGNITINGNLSVTAGTFNLGTVATTISLVGTASIAGIMDFGNTSTKVVTIGGNLSGVGTVNMSGGSLLHTLNLGGASNTIGTLTTAAVGSIVNYTRAGDQQVFASINYRNLTTSGSGIKTLSGAAPGTYPLANATVNGNLTISSGTTLAFGSTNLRRLVLVGNLAAPAGTIDMSGFAHELYLGGANNALSSLYTGATINSTVYYNGTGAQQVFASYATSSVGTGYKNVSITGTGIKTLLGSTSFNGTLTISAGSLTFGNTALTLYVGGNLAGSGGTIDMQSAAHSLFLYGISNVLTTLSTDGTASTINYSRDLGSAQSIFASANYRKLTLSGNGTKTLQGATTVNTLNIAGGTLEVAAQNLTVNTTSTIADVLNDNSSTGTNTFVGNVTVASTGFITTSTNSPFVFQGGITNNGTINTTGTGAITFSGNQTINGSAAITMAGAATVASGFTVDNNNSALTFPSLTVSPNAKFKNSHAAFPTSYIGFSNGSAITDKFSSLLASNNAGNAVTSTSTALALTRNGNGSVYALRGLPNFSPVATAMVVKFDLSATTSTSTTTAATLFLGSSLTDDATINSATARVQVNLVNSNTFTLTFPDGTVTTSGSFDNTSTRTVTWVINTTGSAISYVGPDGKTANALAINTADVWVGTTRHAGLSVQNAAQAMNQLKVVMSGGTGTIAFNNLTVNPLATIIASPITCNNALYVTPFTSATFNVGFSTSGMTATTHFNASNTLTAQLSDASGSFATPKTIGTLTTTALNGTIPCSIPKGSGGSATTAGTGYRIRVMSSAPISISPDNGSNIAIGIYTVSPYGAQSITPTTNGTALTAAGLNVIGYQWGYYTVLGGTITDLAGQTSATYTPNGYNFPGAGIYALICRMTTSTGCVATSNEIIIYINCPANTNLVQNGDFTEGNLKFSSGYTYVSNIAGDQTELNPEGRYAVGNNPNDYHGAFCSMTTDIQRSPISGGNMLIGNAATTGSLDLWKQTITVTPYTDYVLTFYASSLAGADTSLFFGIYAGCFRTGADVSLPFQAANCTWNKFSFQLSSGNTTTIDLAIRNISAAASGNDIAIDDIQFYACAQVSTPPFPVADAFTWRGINNNWFDADNWGSSCGLPTCSNDVTIPVLGTGKSYPVINAAGATAGSVNIKSGASLTINSGRNLDVCGDFINNGTLLANSSSTVSFTSNKNPQLVQGSVSGTNKLGGIIMNKTNATDVLKFINTVELANNLTLTKGTLDANGNSVKVGGNFSNAATFTPNGNTVEFNGTGNQQYTQTGTGSFYNLTVNSSTASNTITLNPALTTVTNQLTLSKGIVVAGIGKELSVTSNAASAVSGHSASSYVNGNLRRAVSGTQLYDFPVGDATRYELIQVNVTSNLVGTSNILGFFTSTDAPGSAPSFTESGYNYLYNCGPGYWTLNPNSQPSAGTFDLIIHPVGMPCTDLQRTISKRATSSDPWGTYGSTAVGDSRRNGYTSFSEVVQTSGDLVSLPIQLLTFEGKLKETDVLLSWTTASEINNEYFEIQRSADLKNFETLGRVNGAGTTNEKNAYQFTDKKPLSGINYYRLHQVDFNGQSTNSQAIAIEATNDREKAYLYPNPIAKDKLAHLRIDNPKEGSYLVQLYDLKGIELYKEVIQVDKNTIDIVLSCKDLPSGVYLVRLVGLNPSKENAQWNMKLVIE